MPDVTPYNHQMEVKKTDKKRTLVVLSLVAMAMTLGGVAATYASAVGKANVLKDFGDVFGAASATLTATGGKETIKNALGQFMTPRALAQGTAPPANATYGRGPRMGPGQFIEVSEEFKTNVVNIAKNDANVQKLLNDGYNVTDVRPIINSIVAANGDVTTKATDAIVMLQKDTTGRASTWVDLKEGKVTRIVIETRTVIEKN